MKLKISKLLAIIVFSLFISIPTTSIEAQCPMCRMSAESNLKNGGSEGKGLNKGILYMLSLPYVMVGTIGYIWWRNRKREEELWLEEQ